jgi:hypothetical protein
MSRHRFIKNLKEEDYYDDYDNDYDEEEEAQIVRQLQSQRLNSKTAKQAKQPASNNGSSRTHLMT